MEFSIHPNKQSLGGAAAAAGVAAIKQAIELHGSATIILGTGTSQFEMLDALIASNLDWSRVSAFQLDEYIGVSDGHGASFRRFLRERVVDKLPPMKGFVMIAGDAPDLVAELSRLNGLLGGRRVDVGFAGIGENGHLAFNDPPANFTTDDPYIVVDLDEVSRRQQLGEGWFPTMDLVPHKAISMSVRQLLRAERLILSVPDARKAQAVLDAIEGVIDPRHPASILQSHNAATVFLDPDSAKLLSGGTVQNRTVS